MFKFGATVVTVYAVIRVVGGTLFGVTMRLVARRSFRTTPSRS